MLTKKTTIKEIIYTSGETHFNALCQDIDNAQHSIDIESYSFIRDALGKRIKQHFEAALSRGVKIRILVDGAGTPAWSTQMARSLEKKGAQTKVFHPFPWQLWNWTRSAMKKPSLLKWIYLILKCNSRNHRKLCLIDNEIAYIGSFNIRQCHLSKENGGENWRDTSVRITHCNLQPLIQAFDDTWEYRTIKERLRDSFKHVRNNPKFRLNNVRHRRRVLYKNLLKKIRMAKKRLWITNAYFIPDNFLLKRLKEAANKGIDVRILLPKKSDVSMMPWASSTFYDNLLQAGVRIFEYLPSMLHAKSLILDDWMLIGSSNLNYRSLLHDLEVDTRLTDPNAKKQLEQAFYDDLKLSRELNPKTWRKQLPLTHKLFGGIILYMKYWI